MLTSLVTTRGAWRHLGNDIAAWSPHLAAVIHAGLAFGPPGGDWSDEASLTLRLRADEAVTVRSAAQQLGLPIRVAVPTAADSGGAAAVAAAEAIIRAHQRQVGRAARERPR